MYCQDAEKKDTIVTLIIYGEKKDVINLHPSPSPGLCLSMPSQ